jgi:hypothetical protein
LAGDAARLLDLTTFEQLSALSASTLVPKMLRLASG